MKKLLIILVNTLALIFLLMPSVAVAERILNYSTLYLFFKFSQNFTLLLYMIIGSVVFCLFIILIAYVESRKKQNIFIFIMFSFSILAGLASGLFGYSPSISAEDFLFFLFGILWYQIFVVLALLGKIKDYTFSIIRNNVGGKTYLLYRIFTYGYLVAFSISTFSKSDAIMASFVNIQDNLFIQVFSVLISLAIFGNAEKIIEVTGEKFTQLCKIFKLGSHSEANL